MEVIRAKRAGACYGVQRALDMADEVIADGGRAYTLGPLIHNPQVVADLAARTLLSPRELPVGAVTALIGAPFFAWVYFRKRGGDA